MSPTRCFWGAKDPQYIRYHDEEWGHPTSSDQRLFEKIVLEGFQSGLSWLTILRKRENFRRAFAEFEMERVARFDDADRQRLLSDAGIVRHRGKIDAAIHNASRALELIDEFGSILAYARQFDPAPGSRPATITRETMAAMTAESKAMSRDLKKRGWKFVGPTTVYSFMQAMGIVNDHTVDCDFRLAVDEKRRAAGLFIDER